MFVPPQPLFAPHAGYTDAVCLESRITRVLTCSPGGPWIAGGCWLRRLGERTYPAGGDIDVFCASVEQVEAVCARLVAEGGALTGEPSTWSRRYALPNGDEWNVITRTYPSLQACLFDFDYTVCQWGWDGVSMWLGADTLAHVEGRELVPVTTRSAERQFNRICQYMKRGYEPSYLARDRMFLAVQNGDITNASKGTAYE